MFRALLKLLKKLSSGSVVLQAKKQYSYLCNSSDDFDPLRFKLRTVVDFAALLLS